MNKVFLIGNLATDVEFRTVGDNVACARFTLAVNRRYTNRDGQRDADFFKVVVWRGAAENCARYLSKGSKVAVCGNLQIRSYEAQDGSKRHVTEIVADEVEFLPSGGGHQENDANAAGGFIQVEDDDMPF